MKGCVCPRERDSKEVDENDNRVGSALVVMGDSSTGGNDGETDDGEGGGPNQHLATTETVEERGTPDGGEHAEDGVDPV